MASLFSKFKFKWWSWELDAVKIVPAIIILLSFLPVLPYEKKEGKLMSVLGFEASVENFYFIGLGMLVNEDQQEDQDLKKGAPLDDLVNLVNLGEQQLRNINITQFEESLINRGASKELAKCQVQRDFLLYNYFYDSEFRYLLNIYTPSPVPIVWMARSTIKTVLEMIAYPSIRFKDFEKLIDKCSNFEDMAPPKGYLEGDFTYKK